MKLRFYGLEILVALVEEEVEWSHRGRGGMVSSSELRLGSEE